MRFKARGISGIALDNRPGTLPKPGAAGGGGGAGGIAGMIDPFGYRRARGSGSWLTPRRKGQGGQSPWRRESRRGTSSPRGTFLTERQ